MKVHVFDAYARFCQTLNILAQYLATIRIYTFISSFVPAYILYYHASIRIDNEWVTSSSVGCNICTCLDIFKIYTLKNISLFLLKSLLWFSCLRYENYRKRVSGDTKYCWPHFLRTNYCTFKICTKYVKQQKLLILSFFIWSRWVIHIYYEALFIVFIKFNFIGS